MFKNSRGPNKAISVLFMMGFLSLFSVSFCHGNDACEYPDQFPFNPEGCITQFQFDWGADAPREDMATFDNSNLSVEGGVPPYSWTVTGSGFYFDNAGTTQSIVTSDISTSIYTINACGAAEVVVVDSCGSVINGVAKSTMGVWAELGIFQPINLRKTGPHPYLDPRSLGMWASSQTVAYRMYYPGYGTRTAGKYVLQQRYRSPTNFVNFVFNTGNSWGWAYHDDSLVEDPKAFFMDPIVGQFEIRAFAGTQTRGSSEKYYVAGHSLSVWEWKCNL